MEIINFKSVWRVVTRAIFKMIKRGCAINAIKIVFSVKINRIFAVNVPILVTSSTELAFYSVRPLIIFPMIYLSSATYAIINV